MKSVFVILCFICAASSSLFTNILKLARYSAPYDPRFPSYITDPLVPCPENNTFVHPRNCSWFYRCHDPIVKGYYHRYYIECPVSTTFNSTLGICDLHHEKNCNGIPHKYIPQPTIEPPATILPTPSVVSTGPIKIVDTGSNSDNSIDITTAIITPDSTITPSVPVEQCGECFQNSDNCVDYTVCPSPSKKRTSMRLCTTAYEFCPPCEKQTPLCSPREYFSPFGQKCYPPPTSSSMACQFKVPCTFDGEVPKLGFITAKYCKKYSVKRCVENSLVDKIESLCSRFVQCSHFPNNEQNLRWEVKFQTCSQADTYYSFQTKNCVAITDETCPVAFLQ